MCDKIAKSFTNCGSILTNGCKYFALNCSCCNIDFFNWRQFIVHLQSQDATQQSNEKRTLAKYGQKYLNFRATLKECGYVLSDETCKYFAFSCEKCATYFGAWNTFTNHLEAKHQAANETLESNKAHSVKESEATEKGIKDIDDYENEDGFETEDEDETQGKNDSPKKFTINLRGLNKETTDFIDCYKHQPCLWDPTDPHYGDQMERSKAVMAIQTFFRSNYKFNLTVRAIHYAIRRVHMFYKRFGYCKGKISETRKFYFDRCSFLCGIEIDEKIKIRHISAKKITFGGTDEFTLGFIDICSKYPVLWDKNLKDYSSKEVRREAYREIDQQLRKNFETEFNQDEIYDALYRLRKYYYNIIKKERANEPLRKSDLVYLKMCQFLPTEWCHVKCDICDKELRSEHTLRLHLLNEHQIGELPLKCSHCETRFAHRQFLNEHEVRKHTKEYPFCCQFCKKGFVTRRELNLHEKVHRDERNFKCPQCDKCFLIKFQLQQHIKINHQNIRPFKCDICNKAFARKNHLEDHIRMHLNIRDRECSTCGKTFTTFHALSRHRKLHDSVKRFICVECGERFAQQPGLRQHKKRYHKNSS